MMNSNSSGRAPAPEPSVTRPEPRGPKPESNPVRRNRGRPNREHLKHACRTRRRGRPCWAPLYDFAANCRLKKI